MGLKKILELTLMLCADLDILFSMIFGKSWLPNCIGVLSANPAPMSLSNSGQDLKKDIVNLCSSIKVITSQIWG